MKAAVLTDIGNADKIKWQEVETPTVTPGHVLVKVEACGVAYRDIIERQGKQPFIKLPIIQGHEFSGSIVSVGEGVRRWQEGDRVLNLYADSCGICEHCLGGDERQCSGNRETYGLTHNGGYAEYALVSERGLEKLHDGLDFVTGATLLSAVGVGYHNTAHIAAVRPGDSVVVTGASGGVGLSALRTAKLLGAEVWAVTSSESKIDSLKSAGADHVVVNSDGSFHKDILNSRNGKGIDVAIDCVGASTMNGSLRSLRKFGKVVSIGTISPEKYALNLGLLVVNTLSLLGSDNVTRQSLRQAMQLVAEGKLKAPVGEIMPMSDASLAQQRLESRSVFGRIVLTPTGQIPGS